MREVSSAGLEARLYGRQDARRYRGFGGSSRAARTPPAFSGRNTGNNWQGVALLHVSSATIWPPSG
ncbi:MAG TPA: hypothetical protein VFZ59_20620, partial [Verrucomicrobiae bacterium]|nr:hypothetical protein [Verrucomicrobiae bacterium]